MSSLNAAALFGASSLLGAGASALGASSANRAGREARTNQMKQDADARRRLGFLQQGPDGYLDFLRATNDGLGLKRAGVRGGLTASDVTDAQGRYFGKFKPYEQQLAESNGQYIGDLEANQRSEQLATRGLDQLAIQNEQAGQDLTAQETARIQRDGAKRLKGLNQQTTAQLGMLGNTSLQANQLAANSRLQGEQENDQILRVKQEAADRFQRARQLRIGLRTGRAGVEGGLGLNLASARRGAALEPAESRMGLFGSSAFASRTVPGGAGQSPLGSAGASLAQAGGQLGGLLLANQFNNNAPTGRRLVPALGPGSDGYIPGAQR